MARSKNNVVMKGTSGTIGKMLVFRTNAAGRTVISRRLKLATKPVLSESQVEVYLGHQLLKPAYRIAVFRQSLRHFVTFE